MTDKAAYHKEYYIQHRELILYKDRMRTAHSTNLNPFRKVDRRISKVLGHQPDWWEREYFLEEW